MLLLLLVFFFRSHEIEIDFWMRCHYTHTKREQMRFNWTLESIDGRNRASHCHRRESERNDERMEKTRIVIVIFDVENTFTMSTIYCCSHFIFSFSVSCTFSLAHSMLFTLSAGKIQRNFSWNITNEIRSDLMMSLPLNTVIVVVFR